jgi:hypothetical protein
MAMLSGGDVKLAAEIALATSVCAWIYYKGQGENPNPEPGKEAVFKGPGHWNESKDQNVGVARASIAEDLKPYHEHHWVMKLIGKVPLMNAMGTWHDNWVKIFPAIKPLWDCGIAQYGPGHVVALTITFAAYAANNSGYYSLPR